MNDATKNILLVIALFFSIALFLLTNAGMPQSTTLGGFP